MTKNIIQISPFAFDHPGGVEQYARTLQGLFPDEMMTLAGGADFPIIEPVKHFPFPALWRQGFRHTFANIDKENTKCIISHIRFAPTAWLAFWIAKRRRIPYIHIEHGTGFLVHNNPFIAWVAKMVDLTIGKYVIRRADKVITVSQAGKEWVSTTFGRSDAEVIYRGFEFPKVERIKNKIPKIGFVGRLTGLKNVAGLLEALSELREEKWMLDIVGDGEERANLEKLTDKLGLTERVNFLGAKSHEWIMTEFYPSVDIFVNPSLQEGLPTTVIEALGMGCQVIATDVGGTREIGGVTLVTPDNMEALKDSIEEVLGSKGNAGKKEVIFSLEIMRNNYNSFFQSLSTSKYYFLINSLEGGGAERVVTTLAKELSKEHHITIITLKEEIFFDLPENVGHIALSSVKQNILLIPLIPYFVWKLRKLLKTANFAGGVSFLEISNFIHILAKRDAIISFRTSIGLFKGFTGAVYKMFMKILYPRAKKIIVNSEENRYELAKYLKISEEIIYTIYNPLNPSITDSVKPIDISELPCYDKEKHVFITTGRIIKEKHHEKIIESFSRLKRDGYSDFLCYIIGDGVEMDTIRDTIKLYGLNKEVHLLGRQKNVFSYLKRAHFFIYASEVEGFPNVLIEAVAMGLPIITSDFKTGAHEVMFGEYIHHEKKQEYPLFTPNGVIISGKNFTQQFVEIYKNLSNLKTEKKGVKRFDVDSSKKSLLKII